MLEIVLFYLLGKETFADEEYWFMFAVYVMFKVLNLIFN